MPTVSVIVPAYNAENTVSETVGSALRQTFADFELLVVDDGSTDGTLRALESVADSRLRVIPAGHGGEAAARNRAIAEARGEFVAPLDADDLWTEDKLEAQVAALRRSPDAGAVYSWVRVIDERGARLRELEPCRFEGDVYAEMIVRNFVVCGSNLLMRRRAVEETGLFDTSHTHSTDREYWIRLARRFPFALVPRYQVMYRRRADSVTADFANAERDAVAVLERAFADAPTGLRHLKARGLANTYAYVAELYLSCSPDSRRAAEAARRLWKAVRLDPRLLLRPRVRRLFQKCLLLRLLPHGAASGLLRLHKKVDSSQ